ncbi:bifunctional phosphatase PAP2/diacylglycerol kinase family protein [Phytoactinopolyspora mesophila]|uniref:Phosphatase PAP2 family protein n=1 Tax=Phytoactinopolyspora mesophila TaxID=2650750 RepID=A0A7K3M783_9ACTN|nr:bifunctional phosphatase PAP2/diacylglycerol kinase family protein [Phytoactinopolyspora mesophila]NDL59179.1 phosphatase PAP2 family protein [Phytoactinopolyspora mesophila]
MHVPPASSRPRFSQQIRRRPPVPVPSLLDQGVRQLSQAANKGRLWLAIAGVAACFPGRPRRAAIRGVATLAVTSAVANGLFKPLIRRRRPDAELTPVIRRLKREPVTTSFPSGHAASAAAFATGVAMENAALGAAVAPLAGAVAYSRVHVGVHHVSDVVAGATLGAGIALAGRRWWPVLPRTPWGVHPSSSAPSLPAGAGLVIVANPGSGNNTDPSEEIGRLLPRARILHMKPGLDLDSALDELDDVRALGAAGGDGTVTTVAAVAVRRALPLAVFPCGTLNHFARDVGITNFADTCGATEAGSAIAVDVATAGPRAFLNTASIGGYPEMVRRREVLEKRLGKWLAMAVATAQVLRTQQPLRVNLDGTTTTVWLVFVGNGCYVPRGTFPAWRPRLDDGNLDIHYLSARGRFSRTRAVLATLTGAGERSRVHVARIAGSLTLESLDGEVELACDGEPAGTVAECVFGKLPGSLVVYRPDSGAPARTH